VVRGSRNPVREQGKGNVNRGGFGSGPPGYYRGAGDVPTMINYFYDANGYVGDLAI
jgi:hypothetical protein